MTAQSSLSLFDPDTFWVPYLTIVRCVQKNRSIDKRTLIKKVISELYPGEIKQKNKIFPEKEFSQLVECEVIILRDGVISVSEELKNGPEGEE